MSKSQVTTREKILDKALKTFNERGIEYVGLRELAAMLDIRVGNITYYFPTKDDLVYELSMQLRSANASLIKERPALTMMDFLKMMESVFNNHIRFRCLLLSVVHLMKQNKHMASEYKKTQKNRNESLRSNLRVLETGGYLKPITAEESEFLVSNISIISRFWISEASISFSNLKDQDLVVHYLRLISSLLLPYATAHGKKEIAQFAEL